MCLTHVHPGAQHEPGVQEDFQPTRGVCLGLSASPSWVPPVYFAFHMMDKDGHSLMVLAEPSGP